MELPPILRSSAVRDLAKKHGKHCSPEFLQVLNAFIYDKIISACEVHNGGRIRLNATVAGFVGIKPKSVHRYSTAIDELTKLAKANV